MLPGAAQFGFVELRAHLLSQLYVAHTSRAGADAGKAAKAAIEMGGYSGIEFQLAGGNGFEGMDAPSGGVHLCAEHTVAATGG